jgi:hypothetical protein
MQTEHIGQARVGREELVSIGLLFWGDGNILELNRGGDCRTSWIC